MSAEYIMRLILRTFIIRNYAQIDISCVRREPCLLAIPILCVSYGPTGNE